MDRRGEWLRKAEALKPVLNRETVRPVSGMPESPLREGDEIVLDFGNHFVGKLTLKLGFAGSHPDAPVWLRLKFCENERELGESVDDYHGWISKGWIQSEQVHVDVLPCELTLPRRYAFRYVKLDFRKSPYERNVAVKVVGCAVFPVFYLIELLHSIHRNSLFFCGPYSFTVGVIEIFTPDIFDGIDDNGIV